MTTGRELGQVIRDVRMHIGLSQRELGLLADAGPQSNIAEIEAGRNIGVDTFERLMRAMSCEVTIIITRTRKLSTTTWEVSSGSD